MEVTHTIDLSPYSGRQKLRAVWNIGDTAAAFYSCVDLEIGGGGSTPTSTTNPPATTTPGGGHHHPTTTAPASSAWRQGATYAVGDKVTYTCRQAHTVHDPNWTPPNTPALWSRA